MNTQPQTLPRRDLREKAFRKYELYIANACLKSTIIDTRKDLNFEPSTFIARFRDAILAKKRFGYKSELIPPTFDLSNLEAGELPDGRVLIKNKTEEHAPQPPSQGLCEADVVAIMNRIASKEIFTHEQTVSGGEELGRVLDWASKHEEIDCMVVAQNGKAFFYTL